MGWGCLADMCPHCTELSWPDALLMTSRGKPITWGGGGYMQDPGSMLVQSSRLWECPDSWPCAHDRLSVHVDVVMRPYVDSDVS